MSLTSNTPGNPQDAQVVEVAPLPRWVLVLFIIAFALVGYLFYVNYQQRQAFRLSESDADKKTQALASEVDKTNSRVAELKGQLEVTSQKLGLTQDELEHARGLPHSIPKVTHNNGDETLPDAGRFGARSRPRPVHP